MQPIHKSFSRPVSILGVMLLITTGICWSADQDESDIAKRIDAHR